MRSHKCHLFCQVCPPVCRRCGVWWLALTLIYITPSPMHRAPSQLLGFLSTSAGTRQRPSCAWEGVVLFGVLRSCVCWSSALKDQEDTKGVMTEGIILTTGWKDTLQKALSLRMGSWQASVYLLWLVTSRVNSFQTPQTCSWNTAVFGDESG